MKHRSVRQIAQGIETSDGAGVKLRRVIGNQYVKNVDPFLMLDEFKSDMKADYEAGFPMHPHRGFETVTYLLEGSFRHRDSEGNTGYLKSGSVQWMTAGKGIIHEEMPDQADGPVWGFQLWVNLPSSHKMQAPRYQDIDPSEIPSVEIKAGRVKVLTGEFQGISGPVKDVVTNPLYFDVHLDLANEAQSFEIPAGKAGFVYVYQGEAQIENHSLKARQLGILGDGDGLTLVATQEKTRLLVIAADPIKEPVVQYGPFVMNSVEEIEQAIQDFNDGRLAG